MIKLLIGGSPCTHWSIAQSKNRETAATGEGWELFLNYLYAKERFKPDFFLYENNKSVAAEIKEQISRELGAPLQYINSALVSAQNRERFYAHNFGDVPQPQDRGILLRDILESGEAWREKDYLIAEPEPIADREKAECLRATYYKSGTRNFEKKITHGMGYMGVPVRVGTIENNAKNQETHDSRPYRVYSAFGKSITLQGEAGGAGAKTGLYAVPSESGTEKPVYAVRAGLISIKGKQYPIKLPDGYYIIRKLTVTECCRLQTLPDDYCRAVSASQAYRGLGNGWTAEVILHLLSYALKDVERDAPIVVLSMYDGIGTGRYCFDRLGFKNVKYYAYEIDKHAKTVAKSNYPDIKCFGDAYDVRKPGWIMDGLYGG